jgi:hypothetical protein
MDLGYEVYEGTTQYRKLASVQDPTLSAFIRFEYGPA